jgi:predicted methyltransferase
VPAREASRHDRLSAKSHKNQRNWANCLLTPRKTTHANLRYIDFHFIREKPMYRSAPTSMKTTARHAAVLLCAAVLTLSGCAGTAPVVRATPALSADQIATLLASPDRSAADRVNDARRKPAQLLEFLEIRPGMVALDLSAGGGYTSELLTRAVGPAGRVYGQSAPRNPAAVAPAAAEGGSAPVSASVARPAPLSSPLALAGRAKKPGLDNLIAVVQPFDNPIPAAAGRQLDLVTLMFNYHDLGHMGVDRAAMNRAVFNAMKSGGTYVVADHAGRPGTGISEAGTLHRIDEQFLRREIEAAGFVFVAEAGFLRNPADPRDRNNPEPPQPKDDFILKFSKP